MTSQSYVSKELTHFVGRKLAEAGRFDEQYKLLIDILNDGLLLADPKNRNQLSPKTTGKPFVLNIDESVNESVTDDVFQPAYKPLVVCYCDIPVDYLGIHMNKYGYFGLSFRKSGVKI